jgi:hydrogenase nickel incorporation protein HypA/HybF
MHEVMVAQSLLAAISSEAAKHKAKPVAAKVSCGQLYAINDEALSFAFEAIARGTTCENLKLEIEHKPIKARCKNCGHSFHISGSAADCTRCGSENFELLPDAPLLLEEIEFDVE